MPLSHIETILKSGSAYLNRCLVRTKDNYHSHNFVEIAYVAEGAGTHIINGIEHETSKGDIFLINYDISHGFVSGEEPLLIYNCIFTPAYFNAALDESRNFFDITDHFLLSNIYTNFPTDYIFVTAHGGESHHVLNIYERMFREFKEKKIGYRDIIRGYVIELLVIICRLKLDIDSGKNQKMLETLEYINAHYKEKVTAEDLATVSGFSPSHFRRTFKALTGKTPSLYVQTLRIQEACKLLKNKKMSVDLVAQTVGYRDIKHFYTVFKRITGKLPKDFR